MDHESSSANLGVMLGAQNIVLERPSAGRHVVLAETNIRYIKSLWRAVILGVPFKRCPKAFYKLALVEVITAANLIVSTKVNDFVSPHFMFHKESKPSYRFYESIRFGEIVSFHGSKDISLDKDDAPRVQVGLVVGRSKDKLMEFMVYNLNTKRVVNRGIRYLRVIECTPHIQELIDQIDDISSSDQFNIPRLYSEYNDDKYEEIVDTLDLERTDFSRLEAAAESERVKVHDDGHLIQKPSEEVVDAICEAVTESEKVSHGIVEEITMAGSEEARHDVVEENNSYSTDYVTLDEKSEPSGSEHIVESAILEEGSSSGTDQQDNVETIDSPRKRIRRHIKIMEHMNGRGFSEYSRFGRQRKVNKKYTAFVANISTKQSNKLFGVEATDTAIWNELHQMELKKVWRFLTREELCVRRRNQKVNILPSSLFLKDKYDAFGKFEKLKARLVCCGNFQNMNGSDERSDTESPTINLHTVLALLAISAKSKMKRRIYDVSGAYLNATLKTPE